MNAHTKRLGTAIAVLALALGACGGGGGDGEAKARSRCERDLVNFKAFKHDGKGRDASDALTARISDCTRSDWLTFAKAHDVITGANPEDELTIYCAEVSAKPSKYKACQ